MGKILSGLKIDIYNCDVVGELFNVFFRIGDFIVVVEVIERGEEIVCGVSMESYNEVFFRRIFNVEDFDDGVSLVYGKFDDFLVYLFGVGSGFLQEVIVSNDFEVGFFGICFFGFLFEEILVNEVVLKGGLRGRVVVNDGR